MISCSRCAKWQYQECANINTDTYNFLSSREDLAWYCPPCKAPAAEDVINGVQIEDKCKKFFETISSRFETVELGLSLKADSTRVEEMGSKLSVTENYVKLLASDISKLNSKFQLLRTEQIEVARE